MASRGLNRFDEARIEVIKIISLRRFIDGGAPRLAADERNHHMAREGKSVSIPFVSNRLRVCVVSYDVLAKANRAELHNPWASIIPNDPCQPQLEFVIVPAVRSAMWATEE